MFFSIRICWLLNIDLKHAEFLKISKVSGSSQSLYHDLQGIQEVGGRVSLNFTLNLTPITPLVHHTAPTLTNLES